MKKVLIITSSLRGRSNSDILAAAFAEGAREAGHEVTEISLKGKTVGFCRGCLGPLRHRRRCPTHLRRGERRGRPRLRLAGLLLQHFRPAEDPPRPAEPALRGGLCLPRSLFPLLCGGRFGRSGGKSEDRRAGRPASRDASSAAAYPRRAKRRGHRPPKKRAPWAGYSETPLPELMKSSRNMFPFLLFFIAVPCAGE